MVASPHLPCGYGLPEGAISDVESRLAATIAKGLEVEQARITPATWFREDLEADSLEVVDLTMLVEEEFDIEAESMFISINAHREVLLHLIGNIGRVTPGISSLRRHIRR